MPFDHGLRLNNRQRIANAREEPIKAKKNQAVDGAEGLFLRSGSPQNVYLLPQHQNFSLDRCPRPKQICDHPNNEPDKISHPAKASPDSRSTASQIEFAIGTAPCFRQDDDSTQSRRTAWRRRTVAPSTAVTSATTRAAKKHGVSAKASIAAKSILCPLSDPEAPSRRPPCIGCAGCGHCATDCADVATIGDFANTRDAVTPPSNVPPDTFDCSI